MYHINLTDGQDMIGTRSFTNRWSTEAAMRWTAYHAKQSGLRVAGDPRAGFSIGSLNIVCYGPKDGPANDNLSEVVRL